MRRLGNVALPRLAHQAGRSIQKEIAVAGRRFRILVDGDDDFAHGTKSNDPRSASGLWVLDDGAERRGTCR
jgi:hypothetical protein